MSVDPERKAEESALALQNSLGWFSTLTVREREAAIPGLLTLIKEHTYQESLGLLTRTLLQPRLQSAVEKTLQTPFIVNDEEVIPWSGGFTVVALDIHGKIQGAVTEPTKGLESYGDLYPYALMKTVLAAHLWKNRYPDTEDQLGIGDVGKFKYLQEIATPHAIYNGATSSPAFLSDWAVSVHIGGSGCAATESYLKELLGGATPAPDTQAGRFDTIFCELIKGYLEGKEVSALPEPRDLEEIRINN